MSGRTDFWFPLNEILRSVTGLRKANVRANCRWVTQVVTTDPPKCVPHNKYLWEADLFAEEPILATLFIGVGRCVKYSKLGRSSAARNLNVSLRFHPDDWTHAGGVLVNLYQISPVASFGIYVECESTVLSRDPKRLVEVMSDGKVIVETGFVLELARIPLPDPVHAALMLIAKSDTEYYHWRWRLKRRLRGNLPHCLEFLSKGRCSGILYL